MSNTQQLLLGQGAGVNSAYIEDVFSTYLYTGTGADLSIVNDIDLATKGGLVWTKRRDASVSAEHSIYDTDRGATKFLNTASTAAQSTSATSLTSFDTAGFSLGRATTSNYSTGTYASWTFRKQPKFFDVVTYTGNGSSQNIAHNLGSTPGCIIVKKVSNVDDWGVWHRSFAANEYIILNTTAAKQGSNFIWNNTAPTSTQFSVGASGTTNDSATTYVAYIFAHDAGGFGLTGTDNVISCGTWTGNTAVTLGYEPQLVMCKRTDSTGSWYIIDNMRSFTADGVNAFLYPNSSTTEYNDGLSYLKANSTGFAPGTETYFKTGTFIYIAIRRGPMKVPTDGTKVFAPDIGSSTGVPTYDSNFVVDFALDRSRTLTTGNVRVSDRLRGSPALFTTTTGAEAAGFALWDSNTTLTFNTTGDYSTRIAWMFRRAPGFFDEVCYTGTGNGSAGQYLTLSHNLQAAPEMMIVKRRSPSGTSWYVYHSALGNTKFLQLDQTPGASTATAAWNDTSPTSSQFTVGSYVAVNYTAYTYVAYLFATCAGVSKVGSYTGTGTTKQVDCGFAAGARFVLIKRTDSTGDWYVWDSARGIVSGNDPYTLINSTAIEVTTTDYVDIYSAGFEISSTAPAAINASGGTYIYLAIA